MRLAAVALIEKGRELLPLFLDEPFSQYDEERVKNAFELLKEVSRSGRYSSLPAERGNMKLLLQFLERI